MFMQTIFNPIRINTMVNQLNVDPNHENIFKSESKYNTPTISIVHPTHFIHPQCIPCPQPDELLHTSFFFAIFISPLKMNKLFPASEYIKVYDHCKMNLTMQTQFFSKRKKKCCIGYFSLIF